jgi:FMN phosphatase YigB (HAD superfamily)
MLPIVKTKRGERMGEMRAKEPFFIFDIGNVLIDFDLERLQHAIATSSTIALPRLQREWTNQALIDVETGKLDPQQFFVQFSGHIELPWSYEQWIEQWADIYSLNTKGRRLFLELQQRGYCVSILSNLAPYNVTAIEWKFPNFFMASHQNFFSFELGFHKPDPNIYWAVCHHLLAQPSQCIFLDDSAENVEGAKSLGMHAIQFSSGRYDSIVQFIQSFL